MQFTVVTKRTHAKTYGPEGEVLLWQVSGFTMQEALENFVRTRDELFGADEFEILGIAQSGTGGYKVRKVLLPQQPTHTVTEDTLTF